MTQAATKPRIAQVNPEKTSADVSQMLEKIKKNSGGKIPNIFKHMGNSPVVLQAFMSLNEAAGKTKLNQQLRSEIALTVAQANDCNYCLSAHTAIASGQGIQMPQILQARKGEAQDPKTRAILAFTKKMVEKRGKMSAQEVEALKATGVSDQEVIEIILLVIMNMFTNYFNHVVDPEIDFPLAQKL